MYERSPRQTASPEEMNQAIRHALVALKGSDMPKTYANIAKRAASYSSASASYIEIYIKRLTDVERADLTIPAPVTPAPKKATRSLSGVRVGWRTVQYKRQG